MKLRKLLSGVLAATIAISSVAMSAFTTVNADYSGTCGDNATWTLTDDGLLTISGTGSANDYTGFDPYYTSILNIVVEEGITDIDNSLFWGYSNVKTVSLPSTLTSLGTQIFYNCTSLEYINIPEGVTELKTNLFYNCSNADLVIDIQSTSLTSIASLAFGSSVVGTIYVYSQDMYDLVSAKATSATVVLKSTGSTVVASGTCGDNATWTLTDDGVLTISGTCEVTDYTGFESYDTTVTSIVVEEGITSLCDSVFYGFSSATSASLPSTLTSLGSSAFYKCTSLVSVNVPEGITTLSRTFYGCSNADLVIDIQSTSITSINSTAFSSVVGTIYVYSQDVYDLVATRASAATIILVGASTVDTTSLEAAITSAEAVDTTNYTDDSVAVLTAAITAGKALLDDSSATQDDIDAATTAITAAIDALVEQITAAEAAYYWTGSYSRSDGLTTTTISDSWTVTKSSGYITFKTIDLSSMTEPTLEVIFDSNSGADTLYVANQSWSAIISAGSDETNTVSLSSWTAATQLIVTTNNQSGTYGTITSVKIYDAAASASTVDTTSLETAITSAEALDTTNYTDDSVSALTTAITAGKALLDSSSATQDDIDSATTAITAAVDALTLKSADYTAVEAALATVPADLSGYTTDSVTALNTAIAAVDYTKNITEQSDVDAMAAAITAAVAALVEQPASSAVYYWLGTYSRSDGLSTTSITDNWSVTKSSGYITFKGVSLSDMLEPTIAVTFDSNSGADTLYVATSGWKAIISSGSDETNTASLADYTSTTSFIVTTNNQSGSYGTITSVKIYDAAYTATTDTSALQTAISTAEALDTTNYTDDSVSALDAAVTAGQVVLAITSSSQNDIDAATTAINSAISALTLKSADYTAVEAAIASIPTDLSSYTDASVTALNNAVAAVDYTKNITEQSDVDAMATAITEAIAALTDVVASGSCGDNATWVLKTDGSLTISGTGAVTSYSGWSSYTSQVTSVVVEEGITSLCERVCQTMSNLTSVSLPSTLTTMGNYIFRNCTSLESVVIPDSVTSLGTNTFTGCSSLKNVTLPATLTTIPKSTFYNCTSLESITIPDTVTSIGSGAFEGCTSLKSVTVPDGVTSIGTSAFYGCTALTSVNVPTGVTTLSSSTFRGCTNEDLVTDIQSTSISTIDSLVFYNVAGTIYVYSMDVYDLVSAAAPTTATVVYAGPVDTTALEEAIATGEAVKTENYTTETADALTSAITAAKAVLANEDATQTEVDEAAAAITAAIAALVSTVDTTALSDAITNAEAISTSAYTSDSVAALAAAITSAKTVLADSNSTQAEVDAATAALSEAVEALVEREASSTVYYWEGTFSRADGLATTEITDNWTVTKSSGYITFKNVSLTDMVDPVIEVTFDSNSGADTLYVATSAWKAIIDAGEGETITASLADWTSTTSFIVTTNNQSGSYGTITSIKIYDAAYVDTAELEEAVTDATAIDTSLYTTDSAAALTDAITAAQAVLANDDATQDEVDAAVAALADAVAALIEAADTSDLEITLDAAEALDTTNCTADSVAALVAAIEDAKTVLADGNATQEDVDKALAVLTAAIEDLEQEVDTTYLETAIADAEDVDTSAYTADSVANLTAALENAQTVLANADSTQDEVDAATARLNSAIAALEEVATIYNVAGTIYVSDEDATTDMTVVAEAADGTETSVTATSMGEYTIEGLEAGTYTITISGGKYAPRSYEVEVSETLSQDVYLNPYGDVNGDGKVTTADVGLANSHAKGVTTLTDYQFVCADVNLDGSITTADVGKINSHAKGVTALW
ncbi:MAG: leucine-rich repeat protein [Ruminococcus sp.]|nr:leucine-rich repeat protein [Ruminococcus sp.]